MTATSYHGRPVLKAPVWTPEIAAYFYAGGMAGAAAPLAAGARLSGNPQLARRAALVALAGAAVSPPLLIADLGRPARFLNMLRVFKPTSPMSVGTWVLSSFGVSIGVSAGWQVLGFPGARAGVPATAVAALTGPVVSTYTAVLIATTAVPVWHDARHELPFVFAGSSLASAGGAIAALTPAAAAAPAAAMAVLGAGVELAAGVAMERRLDPRVRRTFAAAEVHRPQLAARLCTAAGAVAMALASRTGRPRTVAAIAGATLCVGSALTRWAIYRAGTVSSGDAGQTTQPQRERRGQQTDGLATRPR